MKTWIVGIMLWLCAAASVAQNTVNSYAYWFDNQYGSLVTVPASGGTATLNQLIPTASLTPGLHTLHLAAMDAAGRRSAVESRYFYKSDNSHIAAYQYWFGGDAQQAVTVPTGQSGPLVQLSMDVDAASIPSGLNLFNIRFQDDGGRWSAVDSRWFMNLGDGHHIAAYQYWFGSDAQQAVTVPVPQNGPALQFGADLDAALMPRGLSLLNIRFQDDRGQWSAVESHWFVNQGSGNRIAAYKYWFDSQAAAAVTVVLPQPVAVWDVPLAIPAGAPNGIQRTLYFQVQDESGLWSGVMTPGGFQQSGTAPQPSWIKFENVLSYQKNNDLKSARNLWSGSAAPINPSIIKICADGSKATRVLFSNKTGVPHSQIRFVPQSYTPGTPNTDHSGGFASADYTYSGDTVKAWFSHPAYMNTYGYYRNDTILVINNLNNQILCRQPIQVFRTPILMVHGLWGKGSDFETMSNELDNSLFYPDLMRSANYKRSNDQSFIQNRAQISDNIDQLLRHLRQFRYSAGRVDIIAHSMGGLLARYYLQYPPCEGIQYDDCYRQDIHRLITIGTPHFGSQWANLLRSNSTTIFIANTALRPLRRSVSRGAVEDLEVGSYALEDNLNAIPYFNRNVVPTHAVRATQSVTTGYLENTWPVSLLLSIKSMFTILATTATIDAALLTLFNFDSHDLVVASESQKGGLTGQATSHLPLVWHGAEPTDAGVIDHVKDLLNTSPNSPIFTKNGFNLVEITSIFKNDPWNPPTTSAGVGTIQLSTSYADTLLSPNQTLPLQVVATGDISVVFFSIIGSDSIYKAENTYAVDFSTSFLIPYNAYGPLRVLAVGYDSIGFIALDTLDFWVEPTASLVGIEVEPEEVYMAQGRTGEFSVIGSFSDGVRRDITRFQSFNLTFDDPSLASPIAPGVLEGMLTGTTRMYVQVGPNICGVSVSVGEGMELNAPTSVEDPFPSGAAPQPLLLYPNPASGECTVEAPWTQSGAVSVQVLSIDGRIMFTESWVQAPGTLRRTLSLGGLPEGLYLVRLSGSGESRSGRLVLRH
ncbi:MAG: T9SS type A sorting domain-containing protein [Bacteroidia bacterium]|nr:T9SS type A sorting domain-containing protein [Bacteroidia bacterium]